MLIPHSKFSTPILDDMLSDFVTRDGTDNGNFITLAERKAQLLSQLESHQAFITFNADHQQTCLVTSNEVPDDALRDFKQLVQEEADRAEEEALSMAKFDQLLATKISTGTFPLYLGRTVMSGEVSALVKSGKISIEQLQDILYRHSMGDFGVVEFGDKLKNLGAIERTEYMLSRYEVAGYDLYVEMLDGWLRTMVMQVSER
jgi:uncharacterized protein YheU (UPF0270 family)